MLREMRMLAYESIGAVLVIAVMIAIAVKAQADGMMD